MLAKNARERPLFRSRTSRSWLACDPCRISNRFVARHASSYGVPTCRVSGDRAVTCRQKKLSMLTSSSPGARVNIPLTTSRSSKPSLSKSSASEDQAQRPNSAPA